LLALASLAADQLSARPPSPALVRRASLALAALAVLFSVATHAVAAQGPPEYDSTIYLLNGRWLLEGLAPYRDHHLSKMPVFLALAWSHLMAPSPRGRDLVIGGCALALLGLTKQTHGLYGAALLGLFALLERGRAGASLAKALPRVALVLGAALATVILVL